VNDLLGARRPKLYSRFYSREEKWKL